MLLPYSDAQGRPREVQRVKHSFYYGRPELVAWCSVLLYLGFCLSKQRYTLCTPNATDPVVSLGSAHNEVDDLDSHAALTLRRWVIPKAWPQFLTPTQLCQPNDTVRNYFAESDSSRIQIIESLACQVDQNLSNQLRFEGITPWSRLHGGSFHRGWLSFDAVSPCQPVL